MADGFAVKEKEEEIDLQNDYPEDPPPLGGTVPPPEGEASDEEPEDKPVPETNRRDRTVPIHALHEERMQRRQLAEILQRERETNAARNARLQGRLDALQERFVQQAPAQQKEDPEPDPEKDPRGWVTWNFNQRKQNEARFERELEGLRRYMAERENEFRSQFSQVDQDRQEQHRAQSIRAALRSDEDQARDSFPDYDDAISHLHKVRDRELELMGYHDPNVRAQIFANEIEQSAAQAYQRGLSFAEAAYEMAKLRNYRSQGEPKMSSRMENIRRGQQVSRSLSSAPGKTPKGALSLDDLADMPQDEFDRRVKSMDDFQRLLRGAG